MHANQLEAEFERPPAAINRLSSRFYSESLVHLLTFLGICAATIEFIWLKNSFKSGQIYFEFIANILFLNSLHTVFSFRLLKYKLFRDALTRGLWNQKFAFPLISLVLFVAIFLSLFVLYHRIQLPYPLNYLNQAFLAYHVGLLPVHHAITQAYGVFQTYKKSESPQDASRKIKFEKIVYQLLLIFTLISTSSFFLIQLSDHASIVALKWIACGLAVAAAVYLIVNVIKSLGIRSTSAKFSFRFLLLPFKYISFSAGFFSSCCHGVEYFIVNKNIESNLKNSPQDATKMGRLVLFLVALAVLSHFVVFVKYFSHQQGNYLDSIPIVFVIAASQSFAVIHYLMDRQFFKFKDLRTREEISPLLQMTR